MLIFTRRKGQSFRIGHDVRVTVCRVEPRRVGIGIQAPEGVAVDRAELRGQHPRLPRRAPPKKAKT